MRIGGGVGAFTVEAKIITVDAEQAAFHRRVDIPGMPVECRVEIVKCASAPHKDLAADAFFRRAAVVADCAGMSRSLQPLFEGERRRQAAGAQQVVPAAMPRRAGFGWLRIFLVFLRQAGQGVVFASEGDHGRPRAPLSGEGRAQPADIPGDLETLCSEKIRLQF